MNQDSEIRELQERIADLERRLSSAKQDSENSLKVITGQLSLVANGIPALVAYVDSSQRYLYVNNAYAEWVGMAPEEVVGRTVREVVGNEVYEVSRPYIEDVLSGRSGFLERNVIHAGELRVQLVKFDPQLDESGSVTAYFALVTDITGTKEKESRFRELSRRLDMALASGNLGTWEYNFCRDSIDWDARMPAIFGVSEHDVPTGLQGWLELVHQDDRDALYRSFKESVKNSEHLLHEFRVVRDSGPPRIVKIEGDRYSGDSSDQCRIVGICRDVTIRRNLESSTRKINERLSHVLSATSTGLWDWNIVNDDVYYSPTWYTMLGYEPNEMPQSYATWKSLLHPDDIAEAERVVSDSLNSSETSKVFEFRYRMRSKSGEWRWICSRGAIVDRTEDGPARRAVGINLDVTEESLRESEMLFLQEQIRHSRKMEAIGQLAGGVSHDFNNALTVMSGYANLLMEMHRDDPDSRAYLEEMLGAISRATSITSSLLAFSRKKSMEQELYDLNLLVANVISLIGRLLGENVSLEFIRSDSPLMVMADRPQIEQAIINLVTNARDAMPGGGTIRIILSKVDKVASESRLTASGTLGPFARMEISDTGYGMDRDTIERIFEPFFTTKEQGKGTGLGLSNVFGIVKQHSGTIDVESEPGGGSSFIIHIPLEEREANCSQRSVEEQAISGRGAKVLVVDDESSVRDIISLVLKKAGFDVVTAGDGLEGFSTFSADPSGIDIVLTDVIMPKLSGREMVIMMRRLRRDVPVLYMSGYTGETIEHPDLVKSGDGFIQKPLKVEKLPEIIRRHIDSCSADLDSD